MGNRKVKIGVIGISRDAGTTFIAVTLAFLLAKREERGARQGKIFQNDKKRNFFSFPGECVSFVEFREPASNEKSVYYEAALDRHFKRERFTDFFDLYRKGLPVNTKINFYKGINWVVHYKESEKKEKEDFPAERDFPVKELAGRYIIVDNPPLEKIFEYDLILAVIDPLPAKILAGAELYEALRDAGQSGCKIRWILNKDNEEVNHKELKRFLQIEDYISFPLLPQQIFYRSQYGGRLVAEEILRDRENLMTAEQWLKNIFAAAEQSEQNEDFMK